MKAYLAIDAGGTYLKSAVLNQAGEVLENSGYVTESFSKDSKAKILKAFTETVSRGLVYIEKNKMAPGGIGIAFPGPFDYENGIPLMEHKFSNIYGINLREAFHGIHGIPSDLPMRFMHDANAVLAGELWKGNAVGYENAAVVTLGTGLGFAFSDNGVVQCNSLGGPLVTIYKHSYRQGILEDYASQRGFLHIYREIAGNAKHGKIKVSDIGRWADEGDQHSIQTFSEVGSILAEALKKIMIERNIQCLLLGGQISRSFHHFEESLKQGLKEVNCLQKISPVNSIDNAALFGTIRNMIKNETSAPLEIILKEVVQKEMN
jgi:glucokinase